MKRKILVAATCLALSFSASAAYSKQTLYKLGNTPFDAPSLTSVQQLKDVVATKGEDIKMGFEKAGYPELYAPFMEQFPTADIETIQIHKGGTMEWMLYRKNGVVKVTKDVTWGADEPFSAFSFPVDIDGKRYNMIVPWACVNFALASVSKVPAIMPAPAPAEQPEPAPEPVTQQPTPAEPAEQFQNLRGLLDVGYMYQSNAARYFHVRFGAEYRFDEQFSVIGLLGGTPQNGDKGADGASAFTIDLLANYRWDRFFVGAGAGSWFSSGNDGRHPEDNKIDAIINAGYRFWGEDNDMNAELFVEGRSAFDEFDELDRYSRVTGGVRIRF